VASYRQVLEDGPDVCDSESDSEYSDHGEDWKLSEMYAPDMLGPDGKLSISSHMNEPQTWYLPPAIFPKPSTDTTGGIKFQGAMKGTPGVDGRAEEESDTEMEKLADGSFVVTAEDPWTPALTLYGPRSFIKLRGPSFEAYEACINTLYSGRMTFTEYFSTHEWALIGAFGDGSNAGEIPVQHHLSQSQEAAAQASAFNQRIHDAGLTTQNCDKGLDQFIRKSDAYTEIQATMATVKGHHGGHGCATYFTQEKPRFLLLETTYGLSNEEALCAILASWAKF
jgi:hypothetical protein